MYKKQSWIKKYRITIFCVFMIVMGIFILSTIYSRSTPYICSKHPEKCVCEEWDYVVAKEGCIERKNEIKDFTSCTTEDRRCNKFRLKTQEELDIDDCNNNPREDEKCKCEKNDTIPCFQEIYYKYPIDNKARHLKSSKFECLVQNEVLNLNPTMIVLEFNVGDIRNNDDFKGNHTFSAFQKFTNQIGKTSHLANLLFVMNEKRKHNQYTFQKKDYNISNTINLLNQTKHIVESSNITFLLFVVDYPEREYELAQIDLTQIAEELGADYVEVYLKPEHLYYNDIYPNEEGNKYLAEALYEKIN